MHLQLFRHRDVQLHEGPLQAQHQHQQRLFLSLDDDALLKPFRSRAGLPTPGSDMGGWYDDSTDFHVDPSDWSTTNWHGFIPGHSFGQYVSGLARGYAASLDVATRDKLTKLVDLYAKTITPRFFDDYNLPAYTFDKLAIGLIDAHQHAAIPGAREALEHVTAAALPFLPEKALTREERRELPYKREAQIWDEPYTLPENLFLAAKLGMGKSYAVLATRYLANDSLFDALAANQSPFKGKHAYSHVNALSSAFQAYLATGDTKYLDAARNGFAFIEAQTYATGGWGPNEELLAADDDETLFTMLSTTERSFETPCGAYGHFKIARSLLQVTGDSQYGDSMERMLYNTVLGALPTQADGRTFYYSDYSARGHKVYRGEAWPCCSGTFVQLAADYGISSYLFDRERLLVNLYVPSSVTAEIGGQPVRVTQATQYPFANSSRFVVEPTSSATFALSLRIPAWAGPKTQIRVNGEPVAARIGSGSFFELRRTWQRGDTVEITFDMTTRLVPLNAAHPEMVALAHGPLVLFAIEPSDVPLTRSELLAAQPTPEGDWLVSASSGAVRFKPFASIANERYRLYTRVAGG